jgi:hypothetical protein
MTKKKVKIKKKKFAVTLEMDFSLEDLFEDIGICSDWKHKLVREFGREFGWVDMISEEAVNRYLNSLPASEAEEAINCLKDENLITVKTFGISVDELEHSICISFYSPDNIIKGICVFQIDRKNGSIQIYCQNDKNNEEMMECGVELVPLQNIIENLKTSGNKMKLCPKIFI